MPSSRNDPELLGLEARARALGRRIGAPARAYPPFGERRDAGYPNVLRRDDAWVWEVHERGQLLDQRASHEEDDVLYWIMVYVARDMAMRWELEHRVPDPERRVDTRVAWASRLLELLGALDARWEARFRREQDSWLSTVALPGPADPPDASRA